MATTSYFKYEDKLKDESDYHAWKMTLDLTLEGHEAMDYVQGRVVEPFFKCTSYYKDKVQER